MSAMNQEEMDRHEASKRKGRRLCFLGTSFAAQHLSAAAAEKGFELCDLTNEPELVFVSEDTPTSESGFRGLLEIQSLIAHALHTRKPSTPLIITSQLPPGITRSINAPNVFHQAETLRIKDAVYRASHPEMMIVGCANPAKLLPEAYETYLNAFNCPILTMSYESAEFAKIAINAFLISQVETTNMLSRLSEKCGAQWPDVRHALQNDSRIGPNAYLESGRWQDSKHLLRDYVTLLEYSGDWLGYPLLDAWDT